MIKPSMFEARKLSMEPDTTSAWLEQQGVFQAPNRSHSSLRTHLQWQRRATTFLAKFDQCSKLRPFHSCYWKWNITACQTVKECCKMWQNVALWKVQNESNQKSNQVDRSTLKKYTECKHVAFESEDHASDVSLEAPHFPPRHTDGTAIPGFTLQVSSPASECVDASLSRRQSHCLNIGVKQSQHLVHILPRRKKRFFGEFLACWGNVPFLRKNLQIPETQDGIMLLAQKTR